MALLALQTTSLAQTVSTNHVIGWVDQGGSNPGEIHIQDIDGNCQTAKPLDGNSRGAVRWNEVTDIIGGSAGIGFYLLDRYENDKSDKSLSLAMAAGDGLLDVAIATETDQGKRLHWKMSDSFPREMPNYSHGTAGICDFLLALDQTCRSSEEAADYDGRFLKAEVGS